ncbi:MAG: hypothetical protein QXK37_04295 [Candidatus Woesearchaeota archaeon]
MQTPQEICVWYVLPAIRRELATVMISKKMSQKYVAKELGLTDAAVSQYLTKKRAYGVYLPLRIRNKVEKAAVRIINHNSCARLEIQGILRKLTKSGFLCAVHRKKESVPKCCKICFTAE